MPQGIDPVELYDTLTIFGDVLAISGHRRDEPVNDRPGGGYRVVYYAPGVDVTAVAAQLDGASVSGVVVSAEPVPSEQALPRFLQAFDDPDGLDEIRRPNGLPFVVAVLNLEPEIGDEELRRAFGVFAKLSDARVMRDQRSGASLGYGVLYPISEVSLAQLPRQNCVKAVVPYWCSAVICHIIVWSLLMHARVQSLQNSGAQCL